LDKRGKGDGFNADATDKATHASATEGKGLQSQSRRDVAIPATVTPSSKGPHRASAEGADLSLVDELIADPKDPTLAASGSIPETLVLGSLVRLRQEKANTFARRLKWSVIGLGLFLAIAIPVAWSSIPEGWRNLIWVSLNPWDSGDPSRP
jgi:hypothetical protein